MDTIWLKDFLAVVSSGGFSRAADRRAISQAGLSRRIKCLEEWVGTPLFDRRTHSIELTAAGERLKPFAEEALRQLEAGREDARTAAQSAADTLRFASTQALSLSFFPQWLHRMKGTAPFMAAVQLTADIMISCQQRMIEGNVQFLLCHHHPNVPVGLPDQRFHSILLGHDVLVPVAKPSLAASGAGEPVPYLGYSATSWMGRILAAAWNETGQPPLPQPCFSSHLATALVTMARYGHGLAWSPLSLVANDIADGRLARIEGPLEEIPIEIRLFRPRARLTWTAERFWQRLTDMGGQDSKDPARTLHGEPGCAVAAVQP